MVMWRNGMQSPVNQWRDEMDRLLIGYFGPYAPRVSAGRCFPAVNVWEDANQVFVEAEVPGLRAEDLDISVVGNEVTIRGDRSDAQEDKSMFRRRERGVGTFTRVLRLPTEVNAGGVQASLKDGVLLVTLSKSEAAKPRKIQVSRGGTAGTEERV